MAVVSPGPAALVAADQPALVDMGMGAASGTGAVPLPC